MDYYVDYYEDGGIKTFYTSDVHDEIPEHCLKITESEWRYLVKHKDEYCVDIEHKLLIWCGKKVDLAAELTTIRAQRDLLLQNTDWLMQRHLEEIAIGTKTSLTSEQYRQMLVYRQELREFPSKVNVTNPEWPVKPF